MYIKHIVETPENGIERDQTKFPLFAIRRITLLQDKSSENIGTVFFVSRNFVPEGYF